MHPSYHEEFQDMRRLIWSCCRQSSVPMWTFLKATAIARKYRKRLPLRGVHVLPVAYYKETLPRFEAEVQYYELRYEAERCRPEDADRSWAGFWLQEVSRMPQLIEANPGLYAYFHTHRTDRDHQYFGGDPEVAERNSGLWGAFMALARYEKDLARVFTSFLHT